MNTETKTPFVAKYADSTKIVAAIKANTKKHNAVDTEWQDIAMSVLAHIEKHRDVSVTNNLVNALYKGLGKGARHVAMTEWILKFAPVVANIASDKAEKPFVFSKAKAKDGIDFDKASQTMWYDMKPSKSPDQVLDFRALMKAAISKVQQAAKEGKHVVGADMEALTIAAKLAGVPESDLPDASILKFAATKEDAKAARALQEKAEA